MTFFDPGRTVEIGGKTFRLAPLTLAQILGEFEAWLREEPIRRARKATERIEACRDVFGDETDVMKRTEMRRALEASNSPEWGSGGLFARALSLTQRGAVQQLWLMAEADAKAQGIDQAAFIALFTAATDMTPILEAMLAANGVDTKNPPAAATAPALHGPESSPPSQAGSDTPPAKSAS